MNSLDDIDPALLPDEEEIIIDEADDNPFEDAQLVICALDFLTDNPTRYQQALDAGWDMLLVDEAHQDRKSTRLNSSHVAISYAVFCWKKKEELGLHGNEAGVERRHD